MEYKDIRENLEEMMNDNYKDFIKALVSIEKGVNDEKALEEVYVLYMNNDTTGLLSDDFDYMIDDMKEQGKLIENTNELEEKDDLINLVGNIAGKVENFVENFAKVYYSWEQSDKSIDNRMESLKGYLTDELQALNVDTVRKDIPVSSSVRGFQIWTVEPTGDNEFNVTYSVDQLITEGENTKTVHSAYIVSVYVDGSGNMVLVKNPTITNIPKKSSYKPKAIESEGTVDSITTNEINEFLTTFFKLYPTATASELSYYVNDGILKPIGKEYIFQELVNPIHNRKDNQVTVSLTVEYIDQQTKATQVSQFDLVLEKNGSNWKIVK